MSQERRANQSLRELLDELIALVRLLARDARAMQPAELERLQQRMEWLADEIWVAAVEGRGEQ